VLRYNQKSCVAVIVLTLTQTILAKQVPGGHVKTKLSTQQSEWTLNLSSLKLEVLPCISKSCSDRVDVNLRFVWSFLLSLKYLILNTERGGP